MMKVLCVGGPLDGQTMTTRWDRFAADATPPMHISEFSAGAAVTPQIVEYTVRRLANSRCPALALIAVLDGQTVPPESMTALYDRAVRLGCVA